MTPSPTRNQILTGWVFVLIQVVLLLTLIVLPRADQWPVPGWLNVVGLLLVAAGLVLVAVAALGLGPGLTPTPVPTDTGQLITTGLYRCSRHPIYSGVLVLVLGLVIRSGSVATLVAGAVTAAFFTVKARWEEQRLQERYPEYGRYAASTGRFFPVRPRSRRPAGR
jgi:protein-S-isoprenylcysteine O-methyltransferase Ste14